MRPKRLMFIWIYGAIRDLHLNKEFGGIPSAMREKGYTTTMIVDKSLLSKKPEYIDVYSVKLTNSPIKELWLRGALKLFKRMWCDNPQIILFRHPYYYSLIIIPIYRLLGSICGRKSVFIYKMDSDGVIRLRDKQKKIRKAYWVAASYIYDRLTIETSCGLERLSRLNLINRGKICVVPNSYSVEAFRVTGYAGINRRPIILTVARVSREKGLEYLVKAFAKLADLHPTWNVEVAGDINDHKYYEELKNLITQLHLDNRIFFLGNLDIEDLRRRYLEASIFCLPSLRESFGIARLEAMVCGLPVVTTAAGCGKDFGEMGCLIVPCGDQDALAAALNTLMADESLRQNIAKKQQTKLVSWDKIANQILSVYTQKYGDF